MEYQNYNFKDFILDEEFQQWVLAPDADNNLFWLNWLQNHPEKQPQITRAKAAILELHLAGRRKEQALFRATHKEATAPTTDEMKTTWENIAGAIKLPESHFNPEEKNPASRVMPLFSWSGWAGTAASVVLIIAIGAIFWLRQEPVAPAGEIIFTTTFGETKRLTLPDNSTVVLNANSRLTTAKHWPAGAERTVKIAGEAFFSVVHTPKHQKFKVALQKGARVEVLGTEFTVTDRPTISRVVLNRGKVKVEVDTQPKAPAVGRKPSTVTMAPGELVNINEQTGQLSKSKISNPAYYAAFTKNLIEFNNAPLSEVARVLQDDFGYQVTFVPASLANKRFTSSNPSNRIDLLLFALEKSFNLQVIRQDKHLTIQAK